MNVVAIEFLFGSYKERMYTVVCFRKIMCTVKHAHISDDGKAEVELLDLRVQSMWTLGE